MSDTRSPRWARSWIGQSTWAAEHLNQWVLVDQRRRFMFADHDHAEVVRYSRMIPSAGPREEENRRIVHLTLDDEPDKTYLYVDHDVPMVYYALSESDGVIKIGTSRYSAARVNGLASGTRGHGPWRLVALELGSYKLETSRHQQFDEYWIAPIQKGEGRDLFEPGPRLIEHINQLLERLRGWAWPVDITRSSRVVLDSRLSAPTYRPPLYARVPQSLVDELEVVAKATGRTEDDLAEAAVRQYLAGMPHEQPKVERLPGPLSRER